MYYNGQPCGYAQPYMPQPYPVPVYGGGCGDCGGFVCAFVLIIFILIICCGCWGFGCGNNFGCGNSCL